MVHSRLCLQDAYLTICVDANMGGHIVEFSLDNENALATRRPEVGSTFWPSPQQAWGWPPPPRLDKAPYTVLERRPSIVLISPTCELTGLQVKKAFTLTGGRLRATYTMINTRAEPVFFAPWEITRIQGGLTFYQSAEAPLGLSTGVTVLEQGIVWHDYRPEMQEQNEKVYGNGSEGWLANVHNRLLLLKEFAPVKVRDVAPGEAEIEIYGHGDPQNPYVEMEQQGQYQLLAPGEQLEWQVIWHLYRLPESLVVRVGSQPLIELVKSLLTRTTR